MITIDPSNHVQILFTKVERTEIVSELIKMFTKVDDTEPPSWYSLLEIEKEYPHVAQLFKTFDGDKR